MKLTLKQKEQLITFYPELREWLSAKETGTSNSVADALAAEILKKIDMVKGEKGEKGEAGYSPVKGKDYWTKKEVTEIIAYILSEATPKKGEHYWTEEELKQIKSELLKLATPKKGVHYFDGEQGIPGKDGSPDEPKEIARKLNTMKEVLDVTVIKGAVDRKELDTRNKVIEAGMARIEGRVKLVDQRWHGGGLSTVSHDSSLTGSGTPSSPLSVVSVSTGYQDPVSGVIDGVNKTFVWAVAPKAIVVDNGSTINKQNRAPDSTVNWTGTTTTVLTVAPTFNIFAVA